jgi:translation initiation factor 2A
MESWKKVLKNVRPRAFNIILEDVRIYATETYGYVTCVEVIDADDSKGRIAATNVFEEHPRGSHSDDGEGLKGHPSVFITG